jgi:hypothetical protein
MELRTPLKYSEWEVRTFCEMDFSASSIAASGTPPKKFAGTRGTVEND